jgi:hypothetical protein
VVFSRYSSTNKTDHHDIIEIFPQNYDIRLDVIVWFVDIGGIVDYHCL